jgi:hypothetical protein
VQRQRGDAREQRCFLVAIDEVGPIRPAGRQLRPVRRRRHVEERELFDGVVHAGDCAGRRKSLSPA